MRENHGRKLADLDSVQGMLGDAAMQIEIGRLLTMRAAVKLDAGDFARKEISMAKIVVADALHRAADTGIQLCGARGYSKDTPLEWIYRYARQARLVDGASEVHNAACSRATCIDERDALLALGRPAALGVASAVASAIASRRRGDAAAHRRLERRGKLGVRRSRRRDRRPGASRAPRGARRPGVHA